MRSHTQPRPSTDQPESEGPMTIASTAFTASHLTELAA